MRISPTSPSSQVSLPVRPPTPPFGAPPFYKMEMTDVFNIDMGSGVVCAMVWQGREAVKIGRSILGATNPLASAPGTIRGDYAIVRRPLL